MEVEPIITLGNLLTIVGFVVTGLGAVMALKGDVKVIATRLTSLEQQTSNLTRTTIDIARQESRLDSHSERISRLERELDEK